MSKDDQLSDSRIIPQEKLRRRPRDRKSVYTRPINPLKRYSFLVAVLLVFAGFVYYRMYYSAHYAIALNDEPVVALTTREQSETAVLALKRLYSPYVPEVVKFDQGELTVYPLHHRMRVSSVTQAVEILRKRLTVVMEGEAIFVAGTPRVMVASHLDALRVMELAQDVGARGRSGIPTFKERVVLAPFQQHPEDDGVIPVLTPMQAARELMHPPRPQYYTVERGDSFYSIAMANSLTVNQIRELNPTLDPGALQPGDKVRLPDILAPLTVVMR